MLTIKNFLSLDLIPWYKNLTAAKLPEDRPIEYVSVNDLPLDSFIRKNELVITIATPYVKNEELMSEFIEGLIKAKASMFLLAIPTDRITLSRENAMLAEKNNLPVLLIPWDVRFADICETVLDHIRNNYNDAVEKMKELQTNLLKSFLDGADINTATKIISRHLSCQVSILDNNRQVVAGLDNVPHRTQIPLEANNRLYGHLCMNSVKTQKSMELIINTLSPLLSLWFYRDEIIETTQFMAKDDLIWSLANGSDPASEEIQRAAKLMDLHLNRTYVCIVGRLQLKGKSSEQWREVWIDSNIKAIENNLAQTAKSMGREAMVTYQNNVIVMYLATSSADGKNQIARFLNLIEEKIQASSGRLFFSWGISEIKEGTTDFCTYYRHAKLAEELCEKDICLNQRYFYENTLIYNMMSTLSSDEEFMENAYDILAPVIEYDRTKNTKLMDTLRVYLSCKNVSETSRKLNRHRQTLLYQLEKIEELTGMSLKSNDELFLLEVCTRLQADLKKPVSVQLVDGGIDL